MSTGAPPNDAPDRGVASLQERSLPPAHRPQMVAGNPRAHLQCAVIMVPGGSSMVYDAGHWNGEHCLKVVRELITGDAIDLLIISHSDADHLGDGARNYNEKRVRHTILAGEPRTTASWRNLVDALADEVKEGGSVLNLQSLPLVPGATVPLGEAVVTLVAGWPRWDAPGPTPSERLNAISIVVRLEYRGRSILFTGDTVRRRLDDDDDACKDAEQVMVERHGAGQVRLKSDVLITSHHGANNDSATDPRRAVCRERDMQPSYRGPTRRASVGLLDLDLELW